MRGLAIAILFAPAMAHGLPIFAQAPLAEPEPATPDPEPAPAPEPEPVPPAEPTPTVDELTARIDELETKLEELDRLKQRYETTSDRVGYLYSLSRSFSAFLDLGAFAVAGDGSGIRSDFLHTNYPEYRNSVSGQWVFMGDPFTTAINSLGEPADTASSREVPTDSIDSGGKASFLVNSVGLAFDRAITDRVAFNSLVQFLPRSGPDLLDVTFAYIDWRPSSEHELNIRVGKIDPVLGIEYRTQDAHRRLGITPSLIWRYTCGRPIGVRAQLTKGMLHLAGTLANGDNFDERFESSDLRIGNYPTLSLHAQYKFLDQRLVVGASAASGPQDGQTRAKIQQWHIGFDAQLEVERWTISAEFVRGKQQGSTTGDPAHDRMLGIERPRCDVADCLTYKGAYILAGWSATPRIVPYARFDWRDAIHREGADFVYESHSIRSTIGVNVKLASRITAKGEYSMNRELGVPYFPHDVVTGSLVVVTD